VSMVRFSARVSFRLIILVSQCEIWLLLQY